MVGWHLPTNNRWPSKAGPRLIVWNDFPPFVSNKVSRSTWTRCPPNGAHIRCLFLATDVACQRGACSNALSYLLTRGNWSIFDSGSKYNTKNLLCSVSFGNLWITQVPLSENCSSLKPPIVLQFEFIVFYGSQTSCTLWSFWERPCVLSLYAYSMHFLTWEPFHICHKCGRVQWYGSYMKAFMLLQKLFMH